MTTAALVEASKDSRPTLSDSLIRLCQFSAFTTRVPASRGGGLPSGAKDNRHVVTAALTKRIDRRLEI